MTMSVDIYVRKLHLISRWQNPAVDCNKSRNFEVFHGKMMIITIEAPIHYKLCVSSLKSADEINSTTFLNLNGFLKPSTRASNGQGYYCQQRDNTWFQMQVSKIWLLEQERTAATQQKDAKRLYLPYLTHNWGSVPRHSRIRIGNLGLSVFRSL